MIISRLSGGLGNQLFQYAIARHLSIKHKTRLYLDFTLMNNYELRNIEITKFNLQAQKCPSRYLIFYFPLSYFYHNFNNKLTRLLFKKQFYHFKNKEEILFRNVLHGNTNSFKTILWNRFIIEKQFHFDKKILNTPNYYLIMGYYFSEKYFLDIRRNLLEEINYTGKLNNINEKYLNKILNTNSISIHIRRGDYLKSNNQEVFINLPIGYYELSINLIKRKIKDPFFVFFSDDIEWVKRHFTGMELNCIFIEGNTLTPYIDLHLMKNCKHNITANSTFSWWGAWLNENKEKIVLTPFPWFNLPDHNTEDLIPESWIKISYKC